MNCLTEPVKVLCCSVATVIVLDRMHLYLSQILELLSKQAFMCGMESEVVVFFNEDC